MGDPSDPYLGKTLAREYTLRRNLGSGEIGMVYEAVNEDATRRVAVKVLHEDVAEAFGDDLLRWAKRAAQIKHKKIARILGATRIDGGPTFIVTEFVPGDTLMAVLKKNGPLEPDRVAELLFQLCSALAPIHKAGRPHANLKPENVFIEGSTTGTDVVTIVDVGSPVIFGAHHLSGERQIVGSPKYFSPEQASGESVGLPSDQFTLGVLGYLVLTGALPFFGATPDQLLAAIMQTEPLPITERNPNVPKVLADVVHRCLMKRPEDRFDNLRALAVELANIVKMARRNELSVQAVAQPPISAPSDSDRTVLFTAPVDIDIPDPEDEVEATENFDSVDGSVDLKVPQAILDSEGPQTQTDIDDQSSSTGPSIDSGDPLAAALAAASADLGGGSASDDSPALTSTDELIPETSAPSADSMPEESVDFDEDQTFTAATSALLDAISADTGGVDVSGGGLNLDDAFEETLGSLPAAPVEPVTTPSGSLLADDLISGIDEAISISQSRERPTDLRSEPVAPVASMADFGEVSSMTEQDKKSRLMSRALQAVRPENLSRPWMIVFLLCVLIISAMAFRIAQQESEAERQSEERVQLQQRLKLRAQQEARRKEQRQVYLVSDPSGAEVYIGTVLQGRTPMTVTIGQGAKKTYQFKLAGFQTLEHLIDSQSLPQDGKVLQQEIKLVKAVKPTQGDPSDKASAAAGENKPKASVVTIVVEKKEVVDSAAKTTNRATKGTAPNRAGKTAKKRQPKPRLKSGAKKRAKPASSRNRPKAKPRRKKKPRSDLDDNPFD